MQGGRSHGLKVLAELEEHKEYSDTRNDLENRQLIYQLILNLAISRLGRFTGR